MQAIEIKKNVHWVGAIDWCMRDFHGFSTEKGTTYNSYLVTGEKTALVDTVKAPFTEDLLQRISEVTRPENIDYIVVNHSENDHSGALPKMIDIIKPEKVFCTANGKDILLAHYHRSDWPYEIVKSGDTLSLGSKTLHFLETRMLHWPDSMFTYIPEDELLLSNDAFGMHWATSERFEDQVNSAELIRHARKYYANILTPFSPLVRKLIEKVGEMDIKISMIAPSHGPVWRTDPGGIIGLYDSWSRNDTIPKAVIAYDTMWNGTEKMAMGVADGLLKHNISVKIQDVRCTHRSDIMTEIHDAKAVVFGCSTLNNNILPRMGDLVTYLKGLKPPNKIGAAFGAYGWSGEAVKILTQFMEELKMKVIGEGLRAKYTPDADALAKCVALGESVGLAVKNGADGPHD